MDSVDEQAPKVVVVIPTYNYADFLRDALDSAVSQDYPNLEVFVANDGSTDNTEGVLASYGDRITVRHWENRGVYSTRQAALSEIEGDFFLNLDADNRLKSHAVRRFVEAFREVDPRVGFIYSQREFFGIRSGVSQTPEFSVEQLKLKNYIDMGCMMRMSMVKEVGFDPAFNSGMGDYDFFLSAVSHGYEGKLLDEPLWDYRVHKGGITTRFHQSAAKFEITRRLIEKHSQLYTEEEKKTALARARNKVRMALQKVPPFTLSRDDKWRRIRYALLWERNPVRLFRAIRNACSRA